MPIEIRPARGDELDRVHFVVAYSFSGDRTDEGRQRMRHVEEMAPPIILLDDGEIVASLRLFDFTMLVNGAPIGLGGVSSVSCLPEHRRKGHVGRLLRHALEQMRERGQPLSGLYTPHPDLYRRYGWMDAAGNLRYSFHPKHVRLFNAAPPAGRAVRITEEDWPALAGIYDRFSAGRTGYMQRTERWWKEAAFRYLYDAERNLNDVVVWEAPDGTRSGYLIYRPRREVRDPFNEVNTVSISQFVTLTGDAYRGLLRYVLSHDLADEIAWYGPLDDPLAMALDNAREVKRQYIDDLMLRVVDVEQAIAARPAARGAPDGAFAVEIADASAPWNHGAWRIECSAGHLSARRHAGPGDISTDACTFAAIYDGFLRATDAGRCGLADVNDPQAAELADRVLASDYPPFGSDFF